MNTKSKSKKGKEKGIIGITLAAIMIASIFAAINPVPVSARVITLDGDSESYLGEWVPGAWPTGDWLKDDPANDVAGGDIHGYDLRALWQHYDEANDTMYFRLDVDDMPADLDGNNDTDTVCSIPPGDCPGVGNKEQYTIILSDNVDPSGKPGLTMMYNDNICNGPDATAAYGHLTGNDCVEFSLTHASDYIDLLDFCIVVSAGGLADNPGEDIMDICIYRKAPPELDFNFNGTDCLEVEFNAWATDNASIVNFTWDFGAGESPRYVSGAGPFPITTDHTFNSCNDRTVKLTACNAEMCASVQHLVHVACGPSVSILYSPMCYEVNGTDITFDGTGSSGESMPLTYSWSFIPGTFTGTNDNGAITTVLGVNAPITATLTVTDALNCEANKSVSVDLCSGCSLRIYGTFNRGPGDFTVTDPETGLPPENKPYSDPVGPFHPQNEQAPRKDFITFNPAIMPHNSLTGPDGLEYPDLDFWECEDYSDVQIPNEKVFKRMWYEKEWFKDHDQDGEWDVVVDTPLPFPDDVITMTLDEWNAIPAWIKERDGLRIREWNNDPRINDSNVDIYGPAINQEFTYMFVDEEIMPALIGAGSTVLIPMASYEDGNGLDSFDADGDGELDYVKVGSEQSIALHWTMDVPAMDWDEAMEKADIDGDWLFGNKPWLEAFDNDDEELSGDESVVFSLERMDMSPGSTIQFFDHVVTLTDVQEAGDDAWAIFDVCDNEGGGSQRCSENVGLGSNDVQYFYRGQVRVRAHPAERPTFYLRLVSADAEDNTAIVELGRMFGNTYANTGGSNPFWSQKAFMVDGVFYNVVAIKAVDNCIKYVTFRQKLPKMPIKLYGKHLERWDPGEVLPEMPPFNMDHDILIDVQSTWTRPYSQQDKIGPATEMPPLTIDYIYEGIEERYKGEFKEIYYETQGDDSEFWTLEWFWTLPWQYTEFRLPKDDRYLVTLSWIADESEITLWDSDPDGPVANYTGERFKFWYQDCSGPIYIDNETSSIRLYGTFDEGPGDHGPNVVDRHTGLPPENKPYTDPMGPFDPQHEQAPHKDFMTFNPAIMDHNQGYPELDYWECACYPSDVQTPKEKVFKRMWYEKEWFKDHSSKKYGDGCFTVVVDTPLLPPDDVITMCLEDWNAIPEWIRERDGLSIREWNNDETIEDSNVDIYGPAINQEFTYMFVDEEIMPALIGAGSTVLIPMASYEDGNGLDSFDADGDGERDAVRVTNEEVLALKWAMDTWWTDNPIEPWMADIDGDGLEWFGDFDELSGDESVIFQLESKYMNKDDTIQFFDHVVTLTDVHEIGDSGQAIFDVCDNEGGGSQRCTPNVGLGINDIQYFYRGQVRIRMHPSERPTFYLRVVSADAVDNTAIVEVGRMFGETYANIGGQNPFWSQKAFMVDGVFYNVVAIKAEDNCIKYVTFRQKLPKEDIKLYGKHLKTWKIDSATNRSEILPEMPPFNEDHEILIDVQNTWTRPYSQQDKIGDKVTTDPLEIWYIEEDVEERFKGELKEIYNETFNEKTGLEDEYWNLEWFHTQPDQYTAFVMNNTDQLYLLTLAWYAPQSEITIWDHDVDGPMYNYIGERVKFWYDAGDEPLKDLYVNKVGAALPAPTVFSYYNSASHGGNGDECINLQELVNAIMDYLYDVYPFGDGLFDRDDLIDCIEDFIAQPPECRV